MRNIPDRVALMSNNEDILAYFLTLFFFIFTAPAFNAQGCIQEITRELKPLVFILLKEHPLFCNF